MQKTNARVAMMAAISLTLITTTHAAVNPTVETRVQNYFRDAPVMVRIAKCESGFVHYDPSRPDGVLKNPNSSARGVFQILTSAHGKRAKRLGHDLWTLEGNLAYAKYLYRQNGTRDWNASRHCWGK